jgi:hypothetical protein
LHSQKKSATFAAQLRKYLNVELVDVMVIVAQQVRAPDCGSGGRGFEPRLLPQILFFAIKLSAVYIFLKDIHRFFYFYKIKI